MRALPESAQEYGPLTTEGRGAAHDSAHHDASTGRGAVAILGSRWCCGGVGAITWRQGAKRVGENVGPLFDVQGVSGDLRSIDSVMKFVRCDFTPSASHATMPSAT